MTPRVGVYSATQEQFTDDLNTEKKVLGSLSTVPEQHPDGPLPEKFLSPELENTTNGQQGECSEVADFRREDHRLRSLGGWPTKVLDAERVARNGLYYFGDGDAIRCHFCNVELRHWKAGDDVEAEHKRCSPTCSFLQRKPVGNVPSGRDEVDKLAGIGRPAHPEYLTEEARIESFRDWPVRMRQTPESLAEAGFYYTGSGDQTMCYHCGGGLKDWEDDDEPWKEHALWFNRCPYLRAIKGEEFIRKINPEDASYTPEPAHAPAPAPHSQEQPMEQDASKTDGDSKLCKICYGNDTNVCFVPCGHVVACERCATSLDKCPVCRQPYESLVKLFYS